MTISGAPQVLRYTAFSRDPRGGNPAGVVLDAGGMDAAAMLATAADVGYSETAFVVARDDRTLDVRYFSPRAEVSFCGHATVATAVALASRIGPGGLLFRTAAGDVPVSVTVDADGVPRAELTSVVPYVTDAPDAVVAAVLATLGWRPDELDPGLPPRIAYAGARHLVLAAATRARLAELDYDVERLAALMTEQDLTTLQLVWRESESVFHVRDPFPVGGVVEDAATGAAALAFGAYLRELGPVPEMLTLRQGDDMGRPGVLTVELRPGDAHVRVSGEAVPIG